MEQTTKSHSEEFTRLAITFALLAILLKIAFYNETIITTIKTTATIFWLLIIPGYCATLIWKEENSLLERIIISIPVSAAILGITSYYLGLAGVNLKIQTYILPAAIIIGTIAAKKMFTKLFKHQH